MKIKDLEYYSSRFLNIITKDSQLKPLGFNFFQKKAHNKINELRKSGKPIRVIILKARQIGMSTFCSAFTYHNCATSFRRKGVVIADKDRNTNNLFEMSKRFYQFSDPNIRPMRSRSNAKELVFANPDSKTKDQNPGLMSSILLETANNDTAGRSGTINTLHCSEVAFWRSAGTITTALLQAVPKSKDGVVFFESTANGISGNGEEFYNRWQSAYKGDSDYTPMFFPWWQHPEYQMVPDKDYVPSDHTKEIMDRFDLTINQANWYDWTLKNEMGSALINPIDQMRQEFPSFPEEAFIASGRSVFDIMFIQQLMEESKSHVFNSVRKFDVENIKFYEQPKDEKIYAIGADVAEGIEGGDFSTFCVIDRDLNICATWCGSIDPNEFGKLLCKVGDYYNHALLAPEKNNHGHTVLTKIKDLNYSNLYTHEVLDEKSNKWLKKVGWLTQKTSKIKMLDDLVTMVNSGEFTVKCIETLKEMSTLYIESDGSVSLNGKDRVVAHCIALQAIKQTTEGIYKAHNPVKNEKKYKTLIERNARKLNKPESNFE